MYVLCVSVSVCVWGRRSWEKRKRVKKEKRKRSENINLFIQINKQTERQIDRRTDRHKSFIAMRYYTELYSKSNSIK